MDSAFNDWLDNKFFFVAFKKLINLKNSISLLQETVSFLGVPRTNELLTGF